MNGIDALKKYLEEKCGFTDTDDIIAAADTFDREAYTLETLHTHSPECWLFGPAHYECAKREVERLAAFARYVLADLGEGFADGGAIQDEAVRFGLLIPSTVTEPCGENCNCAEWDDFPMTCYRKAPVLMDDAPHGKPWGGAGYTIEALTHRATAFDELMALARAWCEEADTSEWDAQLDAIQVRAEGKR